MNLGGVESSGEPSGVVCCSACAAEPPRRRGPRRCPACRGAQLALREARAWRRLGEALGLLPGEALGGGGGGGGG